MSGSVVFVPITQGTVRIKIARVKYAYKINCFKNISEQTESNSVSLFDKK